MDGVITHQQDISQQKQIQYQLYLIEMLYLMVTQQSIRLASTYTFLVEFVLQMM